MISLRNLEKSVKTKAGFTYLLRQINLDIAEGDFVTIMGPSGAGKSTLLSIIGLYDSAWEGEYFLFEQAVHKLAPKERAALNKRHVGFVFQQFHLLDDLTVAENLDIPLSYRDVRKSKPPSPTRWTALASWRRRICFPASSPAASNSSWRWPARSSPNPP